MRSSARFGATFQSTPIESRRLDMQQRYFKEIGTLPGIYTNGCPT